MRFTPLYKFFGDYLELLLKVNTSYNITKSLFNMMGLLKKMTFVIQKIMFSTIIAYTETSNPKSFYIKI